MIDHVSVPVSNLALSRASYRRALSVIQPKGPLFRQSTVGYGNKLPEFWINARLQRGPVDSCFGALVCLRAASEVAVIAYCQTAIEQGGRVEGAPGPSKAAPGSHFGAFFFGPDGNKIEILTFPGTVPE